MIWTSNMVKTELVKAFRVLRAAPARDSYRLGMGSFWPTIRLDKEEIAEQQMLARRELSPPRPRERFSPQDIKRMETVLIGDGSRKGWLAEYLGDNPGAKRCLSNWAIWESQGRNAKEECRRRKLAYSTFRRKRDQAAQALADALNIAG